MTTESTSKYTNRKVNPYRRSGWPKLAAAVRDPIMALYFRFFRRFHFDGKDFSMWYSYYNTTWRNERGVEIPIAKYYLDRYAGRDVFEFGNVLQNYFSRPHVILDKYEVAPAVVNEDIVDYLSDRKFDLVISISTLEHVGWDEAPRQPEKALAALEKLRSLVKPGGELVVTFPIGYNNFLDEQIAAGKIFPNRKYLKRVSADNRWQEASYEEVKNYQYGKPYKNGNALMVATESF